MLTRGPAGVITMDVTGTEPLRAQLLGPVRVWMEERELELGARRQRAVFAMLAMRPNRVVSCQELVDGLWGSDPPASVVNGIHIYVAGLRRELEPGRGPRTPGKVLRTSGAGYSRAVGRDRAGDRALADRDRGNHRGHARTG